MLLLVKFDLGLDKGFDVHDRYRHAKRAAIAVLSYPLSSYHLLCRYLCDFLDWRHGGCSASIDAWSSPAQNGRPHDVSDYAFGSVPDGSRLGPNRWGSEWSEGTSYANAANPAWRLVCRSAHPSEPDFGSAAVLEDVRLVGICAEQIFHRHRLWCDRRISGRNWVDGLRFSRIISTAF